jgi:RNA polymerase-binding transcription factor
MSKSRHGASRRGEKKSKSTAKSARTGAKRKKAVAKYAKKAAAAKSARKRATARKKPAAARVIRKRPSASKGKSPVHPARAKTAKRPTTAKTAGKAGPRKAAVKRAAQKPRQARGTGAADRAGARTAAKPVEPVARPEPAPVNKPVRYVLRDDGVAARLGVAVGDEQTITKEDGRYALPATVNIDLPKGYRPSPKDEYMNPRHLAYFRQKLKDWRDQLVEESRQTMENLREEVRDVGDDAERATRETENSLELRTRDRYRKLISKIDKALRRIEEGRYGFCEETDEEIGIERLEARPIATLSLDAQERREHLQRQMGD